MKWPLIIREIRGDSMLPTLKHGHLVLASRWFGALKPGQIVIVHHDGIEKIKRIQKIDSGRLYVVGDNDIESVDSRTFGWLPRSMVVAKVLR